MDGCTLTPSTGSPAGLAVERLYPQLIVQGNLS